MASLSQLFVALITYVLLKWTFEQVKKKGGKHLSQKGFKRLFLGNVLPIDWQNAVAEWLYRLKDEACLENLKFG